MADQFNQTTTTGYGSRIVDAIKGIPIGLLLIVIGIVVLYTNEGSFDLSKLAQKAVEADSASIQNNLNGQLISISGAIDTEQKLGDPSYLQPGAYVALNRVVEMYAWQEKSESSSNTNTGGSETTTTTYSYEKAWTANPANSSSFKHPEGHANPEKTIDSKQQKVSEANIGAYKLDMSSIQLPQLQPVALSQQNIIAKPGVRLESDQYLFSGKASLVAPEVGDMRISFTALPSGTRATVFGKLSSGTISTYTDERGHSIYRLFATDREQAIKSLHNEYVTQLWLFRLVGMIMLFVGLSMLVAPLNVLLDFVPVFGRVGRGITSLIAIPLTLLIGGTTIIVSMILHNVVALIVAVIAVLALTIGIMKFWKSRKVKNVPPEPQLTSVPQPPAASPLAAAPEAAPVQPIMQQPVPQPQLQPQPQPEPQPQQFQTSQPIPPNSSQAAVDQPADNQTSAANTNPAAEPPEEGSSQEPRTP